VVRASSLQQESRLEACTTTRHQLEKRSSLVRSFKKRMKPFLASRCQMPRIVTTSVSAAGAREWLCYCRALRRFSSACSFGLALSAGVHLPPEILVADATTAPNPFPARVENRPPIWRVHQDEPFQFFIVAGRKENCHRSAVARDDDRPALGILEAGTQLGFCLCD
jgi:hypothetical protein